MVFGIQESLQTCKMFYFALICKFLTIYFFFFKSQNVVYSCFSLVNILFKKKIKNLNWFIIPGTPRTPGEQLNYRMYYIITLGTSPTYTWVNTLTLSYKELRNQIIFPQQPAYIFLLIIIMLFCICHSFVLDSPVIS